MVQKISQYRSAGQRSGDEAANREQDTFYQFGLLEKLGGYRGDARDIASSGL
jgi:hypothetical protein